MMRNWKPFVEPADALPYGKRLAAHGIYARNRSRLPLKGRLKDSQAAMMTPICNVARLMLSGLAGLCYAQLGRYRKTLADDQDLEESMTRRRRQILDALDSGNRSAAILLLEGEQWLGKTTLEDLKSPR